MASILRQRDIIDRRALAEQLAAGIAHARFRQIEGCGHCPQIENPPLFVQALEAFLSPA